MAAEEQSGPVTSQPDPPEITCDLDQTSTSGLRQHLRDLLSERDDLMVDDAILVADELATNAIRHGQAPRQCRLMLTEQGRRLRIEVDDAAPTQPRMPHPTGTVAGGWCWSTGSPRHGEPCARRATRRCGQS